MKIKLEDGSTNDITVLGDGYVGYDNDAESIISLTRKELACLNTKTEKKGMYIHKGGRKR